MHILSVLKISLTAMRANKLRTGLTILGIVIGIGSVIIVYSAGEGIKGLVYGQIESFGGSDLIETEVKVPTKKRGSAGDQQSAIAMAQGVQVTTLTMEDMGDISKLSNIGNGYGAILGQEQLSYGNELEKAMVYGVSAEFINIDKTEIDYGRFFTDAEDKGLAPVAILGSKMKEKLFGDSDPIGKYVKVRKTKFEVIGVMKEKGVIMTMDFDNLIYMPVRTLQKRIMGIEYLMYMMHQVKNMDLVNDTAEEIRLLLRENHDLKTTQLEFKPGEEVVKSIGEGMTDTSEDDFRVVSMKESMEVLDTVTGAITLLLLAIVAISLIVGGVGIMNIMYVVVTERTSEIGLRKAVGARYADIMKQFLIESVLVTILGGLVGVIFGVVVSYLIYLGANYYGLDWRFSVPLRAFVVSLGFSAFFGLVFGIYPARKAARLDPIDALIVE